MSNRTAARVAGTLFALLVVADFTGLWVSILAHRPREVWPFIPLYVVFGGVGAFIVARRPSNPIGWLFLLGATLGSLMAPVSAYAWYGLRSVPHAPGYAWAGWLKVVGIEPSFGFFVLPAFLFPDGHVLSRRWRVVVGVLLAIVVIQTGLTALGNANFTFNFPAIRDPIQVIPTQTAHSVFSFLQAIEGGPVLLLAAVAIFLRFRRSRGEERQQLKWFTFAVVVAMVGTFIVADLVPNPIVAYVSLAPLIPIAAGIAILKYRLYDIDVVINKTVVFGGLAAFIAAVYVGIVVGIGAVIGAGTSKPNLGLSILATAVVAVAFQPVRERMQRLANRLVYGKRATPYEVLSEFGHRMAGTYAADDILPRMARILAEGTGAKESAIWLRTSGDLSRAAAWPFEGTNGSRPENADLLVPVTHQGEELGALSITKAPGDRLTPAEEHLTRDLASQAGLVLRNVRLIEDLKASRVRLVQAQDEERRKIERNIHDGAQQQLVALQVKLGLTRTIAPKDTAKAEELLSQLQEETNQALQDLRDLARGIYPPLLADQGLVAALEAQARRAAIPVTVTADAMGRYPQDIEAAVYFCVLEALQNVAKYAGASRATVALSVNDLHLGFTVTDDGAGFDTSTTSYGTGLQGMADRLAALNGELEVRSAPGKGSTVAGWLPVREPAPVE